MIGDPRVLAPLQQAYLAADDESNARTYIRYTWRTATNQHGLPWHQVDADIRAWTPPPAEPSLDERLDIYGRDITELAATANDHTLELAELKASLERHLHQFAAFEFTVTSLNHAIAEMSARIPEPTAPDDYTPGQYKRARGCAPPINSAPQPAPDLDPVRVEAAAKAAWERVRGQSDREWEELPLATRNLWINDAESFIRAYLKDGGA